MATHVQFLVDPKDIDEINFKLDTILNFLGQFDKERRADAMCTIPIRTKVEEKCDSENNEPTKASMTPVKSLTRANIKKGKGKTVKMSKPVTQNNCSEQFMNAFSKSVEATSKAKKNSDSVEVPQKINQKAYEIDKRNESLLTTVQTKMVHNKIYTQDSDEDTNLENDYDDDFEITKV